MPSVAEAMRARDRCQLVGGARRRSGPPGASALQGRFDHCALSGHFSIITALGQVRQVGQLGHGLGGQAIVVV